MRVAASAAATPSAMTKRRRALMRHRPLHVADVEQADLPEIDGGERVTDERIEARLVDLHVEDAAAASRNHGRLDVALILRHVRVQPGAVEDRAHDVEVDVEAGPGVDDPE